MSFVYRTVSDLTQVGLKNNYFCTLNTFVLRHINMTSPHQHKMSCYIVRHYKSISLWHYSYNDALNQKQVGKINVVPKSMLSCLQYANIVNVTGKVGHVRTPKV